MSDCLLQISHGFYYVRVVCPWFIAPYLLQSLQFVIDTFSVYQLSNYFSISYAVSHDFLKSHCQRSDWLNGIHLIRWGLLSLRLLSTSRLLQVRLLIILLIVLPSQFLLVWVCTTLQVTLFMCYRSTRLCLYSGVLTYTLPIMLLCAVRLRFSNRHGYRFSYLTGSSSVWDFM